MFRKMSKFCLAVAATKIVDSKQEELAKINENAHYFCRPSDLPLGEPLFSFDKPKPKEPPPEDSAIRKAIEAGVRCVRIQVFKGFKAAQEMSVEDLIAVKKDLSEFIFGYLHNPDPSLPRPGTIAIAIGGLSGFYLALRSSFVRRLFYKSWDLVRSHPYAIRKR